MEERVTIRIMNLSLSLLVVTAACLSQADSMTHEVLEVRETRAFAGKLGQRVHREVVLRTAEGTKTVRLAPYHTRFGSPRLVVRPGDRVTTESLRAR